MQTLPQAQGDRALETLRRLARQQGYRAALTHALCAAQAPGSRRHMDAWQWVIDPDAGLFRACQEAIAQDHEALLMSWLSALEALIPDRRESHRFSKTRLDAVLACARAICCLRRDAEPTDTLAFLGEALGAWAGTTPRWPVADAPWPAAPTARLCSCLQAFQDSTADGVGSLWDLGMLFLTGQWPPERARMQLWVVFVIEGVGVLAMLTLRHHPSGLTGLSPDPRTMAFARMDAEFAQTLHDAWDACHPRVPGLDQGHVVWGLDGPPFWLERPLAGPSLSGALKVGLYGLGHPGIPRSILQTVISAGGDSRHPERLVPVGGVAELRPKLQMCQKLGLTLLTSSEEVEDDSLGGRRVLHHLVTAATVSEAVAYLTSPPTEAGTPHPWSLVQYYPYPAEHCFQVLCRQVIPHLSFRYTKGYHWLKARLPVGRVVLKVFDAHPPTWRVDVHLRLRVFGSVTALAPGIHRDGPHLILYCKAVDRESCTVHCEATTVALTEKPWYNLYRTCWVQFHPLRLVFRWLPLMVNRFFDDVCVYDLQQLVETPASGVKTIHVRACMTVFRQVHASLAHYVGLQEEEMVDVQAMRPGRRARRWLCSPMTWKRVWMTSAAMRRDALERH